jgi:phage terminase small subunit
MSDLSEKQKQFCREYIIDLNGTQAAIRAGYKEIGAKVQASRLLTNANVQRQINELMEKRADRTDIKADGVLKELGRIGYADVRQIFKDDGTVKPITEWPEELSRACAGIDVVETFEGHGADRVWTGYIKKIKFWDKPRALELIGKNQKLFTDRVEHSGNITLEALVAGSNKIDSGPVESGD